MNDLLHTAIKSADQAEVYYYHHDKDSIRIQNENLTEINSSISSGYALRVIKDGKLGLANTCNLLDRDKLVQTALRSAVSGIKVMFYFPKTDKVSKLKTFDPDIELINKNDIMKKVQEAVSYIKSRSNAQVNFFCDIKVSERRIINSVGTDLEDKRSWISTRLHLPFPKTFIGVSECLINQKELIPDKSKIDVMLSLYELHKNEIRVPSGKKKVILMSLALHSFVKRFHYALSPVFFDNKTSPLLNKLGAKIFSGKITISDNALDSTNLIGRAFDGEGSACQNIAFVENGVLKNIFTDLNHAAKLKLKPTGNGSRFEQEGFIYPGVNCYSISSGDKSLEEMISEIDDGIIVYSLMEYSMAGNYLAGDYQIPVETAFQITKGKLTGRIKDCILTGNIYDTMSKIAAIENENHLNESYLLGVGSFPAISFEEINIAGNA